MGDIIPAIQARYQFVEAPTTLKEYTTTEKAVEFSHGKLPIRDKGQKQPYVLIQKLQIFADGVLAETNAGSDIADLMLDDFLTWLQKEHSLEIIEEPEDKRVFVSNVEVELDINLNRFVTPLTFIIDELKKSFNSYKQKMPAYQITGLAVNYDLLKQPLPQPVAFQLERRAQQPFESNRYFSAAPLLTPDHLKLLRNIEKWASS